MKSGKTETVKSLEELRALAERFLRSLSPGEKATVVGLTGDLGSGKTAFTKCAASVLGIRDTVTSPTFILEKVYTIPRGSIVGDAFARLIHIDAYRMEDASEMNALDWEGIQEDPQNLIFIEWPEQVSDILPKDIIPVSFTYIDETTHTVTLPS